MVADSSSSELSLHPSPLLQDSLVHAAYNSLVQSSSPSLLTNTPASPSPTSVSADAPTDAELGLPSVRDEALAAASPSIRPLATWLLRAPNAAVVSGFARTRVAAALAVALNVLHADDRARRILLIASNDRAACVFERVLTRDCDELAITKFPTAVSRQGQVLQLLRKARRPGAVILSAKLLRTDAMAQLSDAIRSNGIWDMVLSDAVCSDSALNEPSCPLRIFADRGTARGVILACSENGPDGLTVEGVQDFITKQIGLTGADSEPDSFWGTVGGMNDLELRSTSPNHVHENSGDNETNESSELPLSKANQISRDKSSQTLHVPARSRLPLHSHQATSLTPLNDTIPPTTKSKEPIQTRKLAPKGGIQIPENPRYERGGIAISSPGARIPPKSASALSGPRGHKNLTGKKNQRKPLNESRNVLHYNAIAPAQKNHPSRKDSKELGESPNHKPPLRRVGAVSKHNGVSSAENTTAAELEELTTGVRLTDEPSKHSKRRGKRTSRRPSTSAKDIQSSSVVKESNLPLQPVVLVRNDMDGEKSKKLVSPIRRRRRSRAPRKRLSTGSDSSVAEDQWKTPPSEPISPPFARRSSSPLTGMKGRDKWQTPHSEFPCSFPTDSTHHFRAHPGFSSTQKDAPRAPVSKTAELHNRLEPLQRSDNIRATSTRAEPLSQPKRSETTSTRLIGRLFEESTIATLYPSSSGPVEKTATHKESFRKEQSKRSEGYASGHGLSDTSGLVPKPKSVNAKAIEKRKPLPRRPSKENAERKRSSAKQVPHTPNVVSKPLAVIAIDSSDDENTEMKKRMSTMPRRLSGEDDVIVISSDDDERTPVPRRRRSQSLPRRNSGSSSRQPAFNELGRNMERRNSGSLPRKTTTNHSERRAERTTGISTRKPNVSRSRKSLERRNSGALPRKPSAKDSRPDYETRPRSATNSEVIMNNISSLAPGAGNLTKENLRSYNAMVKAAHRCLSMGNRRKALQLYTSCYNLYNGDARLESSIMALSTSSGALKADDFKGPALQRSESSIRKKFRSDKNRRKQAHRGKTTGRPANVSRPVAPKKIISLD